MQNTDPSLLQVSMKPVSSIVLLPDRAKNLWFSWTINRCRPHEILRHSIRHSLRSDLTSPARSVRHDRTHSFSWSLPQQSALEDLCRRQQTEWTIRDWSYEGRVYGVHEGYSIEKMFWVGKGYGMFVEQDWIRYGWGSLGEESWFVPRCESFFLSSTRRVSLNRLDDISQRNHLGQKATFKWLLSLYLGLGANRVVRSKRGDRKTYGVEWVSLILWAFLKSIETETVDFEQENFQRNRQERGTRWDREYCIWQICRPTDVLTPPVRSFARLRNLWRKISLTLNSLEELSLCTLFKSSTMRRGHSWS